MIKKTTSLLVLCIVIFVACGQEKKGTTEENQKLIETEEVINKDISVAEFVELYDSQKHILLDVRTREEWDKGHLKDAILIDFYSDSFDADISGLERDKSYVLYCRSGGRSGKALSMFKNKGFSEAYNIEGGILKLEEEGVEIVID